MLPKESFFRIHRSFLVNTSYIDSISGGRLFLNGKELPVFKQRRDELLDTVVYKNFRTTVFVSLHCHVDLATFHLFFSKLDSRYGITPSLYQKMARKEVDKEESEC